MPQEILALIDKPWLLFMVLLAGAVFGMTVERALEKASRAKRRAWWEKRNAAKRWRSQGGAPATVTDISRAVPRAIPDAADQLRVVMNATFHPRALLNKPERRLLAHIDKVLAEDAPGWRAMGQVSLGEILASKDQDAFLAINSKRVDLLIVDRECRPLHAIEFQGTGHHQGAAAARDAVKKEALRRAGIGYVEVMSGDTPAELRDKLRRLYARTSQRQADPPPENAPKADPVSTKPDSEDGPRPVFGKKAPQNAPRPSE